MWKLTVFAIAVSLGASACAADAVEDAGQSEEAYSKVTSFRARATAYYPDSSALEGGFNDRLGRPLKTLQDHVAGRAPYVSVAMDSTAFPYGTRLRIPSLEAKYGKRLEFRVVDTGGAFRGKGTSRLDICVSGYKASLDASVNTTLDVTVVSGAASGTDDTPSSSGGSSSGGSSSGGSSSGGSSSGRACGRDGDCNPGNDGSGEICEGGRCVAGCRYDSHCPGVTRCVAGTCR
ncbi:MAG: hypothetical protein JNL38_29270 [Myxococcales bacterium]|jgi:3D (Asp-Asp-Asp) domain-containing protein|nr:hypothetical protein [Myxococcales bacterium]